LTAIAYLTAGLYTRDSLTLIPAILPAVLIGVPIGAVLIHHVRPETFRRVCMSFDAWVVAFGISILLGDLAIVSRRAGFVVLAAVGAFDALLLYRYFGTARRSDAALEGRPSEPLSQSKVER
jgi:hypothetical protein